MSSANASIHTQQALAKATPTGSATPQWLEDVDNVDIMSTYVPQCSDRRRFSYAHTGYVNISDLVGHPATPDTPMSDSFSLPKPTSPLPSTPVRPFSATFMPITPDSLQSHGQKIHRALVSSPISASRASTAASTSFTTPVASPIIAPGTFTHHSPGFIPELAISPLTGRTPPASPAPAASPTPEFEFDFEAARQEALAYWPVWYQAQRQRETEETRRNSELDERRRWELMVQTAEDEILAEEIIGLVQVLLRILRLREELER